MVHTQPQGDGSVPVSMEIMDEPGNFAPSDDFDRGLGTDMAGHDPARWSGNGLSKRDHGLANQAASQSPKIDDTERGHQGEDEL